MEQYFAIEDPTRVDVLRAEQEIAVEIAGVPFFGIVDLTEQVSDGIRVVDYKTGKAPSSRFVEDKLSQVWLYAAALAEQEVEVSEVRLMYLTSGSIDRPIDSQAVTQAVGSHRQTWDDLCQAIDEQEFPHKTVLCATGAHIWIIAPKAHSKLRDAMGPEVELRHKRRA